MTGNLQKMTRTQTERTAQDRVQEEGNGSEEGGGGDDSLRGRAPPGIPLQLRKMPREMIIK